MVKIMIGKKEIYRGRYMRCDIILWLACILCLSSCSLLGFAFPEQRNNSVLDLGPNGSISELGEGSNISLSYNFPPTENDPKPNAGPIFNHTSIATLKDNSALMQNTTGPREANVSQSWLSLTDYVLLPIGAPKANAFHIAVIGDSVAWGNGLKTENKYYYLVADWLQKLLNRPVEVKVYAHSGASISGTHCPNIDPAFNSGCPTLMDQANNVQNADLILVSGGINDVDVMKILDYNTPAHTITQRSSDIKVNMTNLLNKLLDKNPNAKVIVTNYYPILGNTIALDQATLIWLFYGGGNAPTDLLPRLKQNSDIFYSGSTNSLANAVKQANNGANRISFAKTNFDPTSNCYAQSHTWLWKLVGLKIGVPPVPKTDDDMYDYRNALCNKLNIFDLNRINAIGHPNKDGAKEYARAIEGEIINLRKTSVALQAAANNKYVCADNGGNSPLIANRDAIGSWETFGLVDLGNNNVAFKAVNGKYVCADNGGNSPLIANRDAIGSWETFKLTDPHQATVIVTIKNAAGAVIPNAKITVTSDGAGKALPVATTGSNGQATITGVSGTWTYSVSATGYTTYPGTWSIAAGSSSKTVNLQVTPPVTLTLYVRDGSATGPIVSGATVSGTYADGTSFSQLTNSAGYVTLTGKPGTWAFQIAKTGYTTKPWSSSITATQTLTAYFDTITIPTVTNDGGASSITSSSAYMNGVITSTGNENPSVTIYCGPSDGGTNPGSWATHTTPTVLPLGSFSSQYYGLNPGTTYYYRCYASNSAGSSWASSTASFRTLSPISPPSVTNDGGASSITSNSTQLDGQIGPITSSNVTSNSTQLNGQMTSTGNENRSNSLNVTIYPG